MLPTPHCARCGYANAVTWPRCLCCGRPLYACPRQPRQARRHRTAALHRRRARRARHRRRMFRRSASAPTLTYEDLEAIIAAW